MSLQDEPVLVEPVNPPETLESADNTVEGKIVGQIHIDQSAVVQDSITGAISAGQNVSASNSICGAVVAGGNVQFENSVGVVTVAGGKAEISNSKTGLLISPASSVEQSTIGVLFAPQATLGKDVKVIMTQQQALLFGAAFGVVAVVLGRLLRRR